MLKNFHCLIFSSGKPQIFIQPLFFRNLPNFKKPNKYKPTYCCKLTLIDFSLAILFLFFSHAITSGRLQLPFHQ